MAVILTNKKEEILVDDDDFEWLNEYIWWLDNRGYAMTAIKHNGKWKNQLMHRMIMDVNDRWMLVDHINGNPSDNRRSNLRLCTNAENMRNRGATKNNTSGVKGLHYHKQCNLWQARIRLNGKQYTKSFACKKHGEELAKELAIQWLEQNREKLHGRFARN